MNLKTLMNNKIEKYYPFIIAIISVTVYYLYGIHYPLTQKLIDGISSNLVSFSSTLLGFLLTILTIIESIQTRALKIIREGGGYKKLLSYLNICIIANFLTIPIIIVFNTYILNFKESVFFYCILLFIEVYLFSVNFRFIYLFIKIIKS